jgi:dipeptidyl aminopeptidase/acylaminoacyl peptidase
VHRLAALTAVLGLFLAAASHAMAAPTPPSAADFGRPPLISDVSVSPDGKHIVALTAPDGQTVVIGLWNTAALAEKPYIIGASRLRILGVAFLKNDRLLVATVQTFDMAGVRTHLVKRYVTDLKGKNWRSLLPDTGINNSSTDSYYDQINDAKLISRLPLDPQNVLVEDQRVATQGDILKVNVYTGAAERVEHGAENFGDYGADLKGEVRAKTESNFDGDKIYLAQWLRNPDTGRWEEHFRSYAKDRQITNIAAFTTDPNIVYISTTNGGDKTGIYEYDIRHRRIVQPAFANKLFDVEPTVYQSHDAKDFGALLGFSVAGPDHQQYWVDDKMASIAEGLDQALGVKTTPQTWTDPGTGLTATIDVANDADVQIVGWSDDRRYIIAEKSGPKNPGEYYLLTDGSKLELLGKAMPWIDPSTLGDTRLVEYPARDGLIIPAFLTTPKASQFGPGPYPTLIEPHGGPWARDYLDWEETGWTQYFASRGYAVLQPEFRGSNGWGAKLWRAGDAEWGQKMADDNDDGVKWLIAQKIADPKRVAMFGYSYGGYAALAAAIRPNGLYQCTISGAGAGDIHALERAVSDDRFLREYQKPAIAGLDALGRAKEAQIPVLLYHGDRDQRVKIEQSHKFAAALKSAGKPYKMVDIPDMGHQLIYWTPAMWAEQLTLVDDFLKTGCKPGGL